MGGVAACAGHEAARRAPRHGDGGRDRVGYAAAAEKLQDSDHPECATDSSRRRLSDAEVVAAR